MDDNQQLLAQNSQNINGQYEQPNNDVIDNAKASSPLAKVALGTMIGAALGAVASTLLIEGIAEKLNQTIRNFSNAVKDAAQNFNQAVNTVGYTINTVASGVNDATNDVSYIVKNTSVNVNDTVRNTVNTVKSTVGNLNDTVNTTKEVVKETVSGVNSAVSNTVDVPVNREENPEEKGEKNS
jgi:gas vesicle protein